MSNGCCPSFWGVLGHTQQSSGIIPDMAGGQGSTGIIYLSSPGPSFGGCQPNGQIMVSHYGCCVTHTNWRRTPKDFADMTLVHGTGSGAPESSFDLLPCWTHYCFPKQTLMICGQGFYSMFIEPISWVRPGVEKRKETGGDCCSGSW